MVSVVSVYYWLLHEFIYQRSPPTVYHMRATGWEKVSSTNVAELHYQYKDEKMAQTAAA